MTTERSHLRRLLTARGDFWDLRWDVSQLDRAWRNEVVICPPLLGRGAPAENSSMASMRDQGRERTESSRSIVSVPYAKVYLKDSANCRISQEAPSRSAGMVVVEETTRFRIWASVLSLDDSSVRKGSLGCNLYIVKGNPLIVSTTPLACFSSGTDSVVVDAKGDFSDLTDVCLQLIITDLGSHVAVPVDDLLESCIRRENERSLTTWDTQSGAMRGTALVSFRVEKEQPSSYEEVINHRRTILAKHHVSPIEGSEVIKETSSLPPAEATLISRMSEYTNELLGTARTYDDVLGENEMRKSDLTEHADRVEVVLDKQQRRKRGVLNHISFAVSDTNILDIDE